MSANGLEVFDKTIHTTNIWLKEIGQAIGPDRQLAWKVLSVVLHKLRDRLPVEVAAHLGAQLPILVRGVYYDQFQPAHQPSACRDFNQFCQEVGEWLGDARPVDPRTATVAVFRTLSRHLPKGQLDIVRGALPHSIRDIWEAAEESASVTVMAGTRPTAGDEAAMGM